MARPPVDVSPPDAPAPVDASLPDVPDVVVGTCPSTCARDNECLPCLTPGDPGNYCCISGLCLYNLSVCSAVSTDGGISPDAITEGPMDAMPIDASMRPDVGGVD